MVPMRDGVRMAADLYYNFNFWDVRLGAPRDMTQVLEAVKRGCAWVDMNERGHFFSEGSYDILGPPTTDGSDAISWMASQPWSNGKVGTTGCSSTAEWQMAVAALGNPALAAIIPQGSEPVSAESGHRIRTRCRAATSRGSTGTSAPEGRTTMR